MFILNPMSNIGSLAKRDIFLSHISEIANVTITTEHDVLAYAWFRSAEDNDLVPHQWVCGLEVYKTMEASTVTHRSSAAYKNFREAVGAENLLDKSSDLRYRQPLDFGFLIPAGANATVYQDQPKTAAYIVLEFLQPAPGRRGELLDLLRDTASTMQNIGQDVVQSFWPTELVEAQDDEMVVIFQRYTSKQAYEDTVLGSEEIKAYREKWQEICSQQQRTTWVDSGLGFIGR
ncbi:(4S)-4-hydroxy-5-phosphonooxypentane-2,3-dione isomerase [Microdochium nivale]|nr:(4S)-4-hydroxy-5-phosphonooxypentane-2,3-dione isomerase [Microdochium nivale]